VRILIVHPGPNFSVADVWAGWSEALERLGCEVHSYNLDDRLAFYGHCLMPTGEHDDEGRPEIRRAMTDDQAIYAALQGLTHAMYTYWPDVVLFVSGFWMSPGLLHTIRQRNHKIVILHTECPYQDDSQLDRAQFADINLLNDAISLDRFAQLEGHAEYMPHAYRPSIHFPRPKTVPLDPALAADLAFVGTGFASRIEFFEKMDLEGLDVLLGGFWPDLDEDSPLWKYLAHDTELCVDNTETALIYKHARSGINFYRREWESGMRVEGGWAMGPREVEMAACGLFFLRDPRGEGDEILPMLPTFTGPGEAGEKLRWWLAHDDKRAEAAQAARAAIADRTFTNHAKRLLQLLETL
jgi:spore maturation protein CgeB